MRTCKRGHELTDSNKAVWFDKKRQKIVRTCLTCVRTNKRNYMRRIRARAA